MQCVIPEISYHNRDPVLSLDFQPRKPLPGDPLRLATAGSDSHVVIFAVRFVKSDENDDGSATIGQGDSGSKVELDCLCDLTRHQKSVNIVRWSPDGTTLATGDDESVIILWQLKPTQPGESAAPRLFDDDAGENKENWVVYKMIRSHLDDVYDLAWSPCSQFLLSGSVDNSAIITNVHKNQKVAHFSDSQGFVQGVAWNPKHPVLATLSSDRKCRFYNYTTKKLITKTYKALLNMPVNKLTRRKADKKDTTKTDSKNENDSATKNETDTDSKNKDETEVMETEQTNTGDDDKGEKAKKSDNSDQKPDSDASKQGRLFHDDTFKGFFRRLAWSNDGELLVVPSGVVETDAQAKVTHCTYVFTRLELTKPAVCLPTMEKYTIAAKFCPLLYKLRPTKRKNASKEENLAPWEKYQTLFALPYRMVYAVATQNAVMIYDTQQSTPIARVSNIHYTGLTDLSWSPDGRILFVSSTDGFCSIITFPPGELGEVYTPEEVKENETAIEKNSQEPGKKTVTINDEKQENDKEGFNEHGVKSPAHVRIKSNKEGGKSNPKRLKFITLKSPKAKLTHPVTSEIHEENGVDGEGFEEECDGMMDGVVPMEEDTLNLQLEETQTTDGADKKSTADSCEATKPSETAPVKEKKRVPLISVPNGATPAADSTEEKKEHPAQQKKRVELITLSSNPVKPLSQ